MSNKHVDPKKIYEITNEVASIVTNITSDVENIYNSCDLLINNCTEFTTYNGQEVSGSKKETPINQEIDGESVYSHTDVTWQEWSISDCDGIISRANTIQKLVTDINDSTNATIDLISNSQLVADAISNYIAQINEGMSNLTEDQRILLVDLIASSKSESEDGPMVGITDENKKYWIDDVLYADENLIRNGRVPIYQIVNGEKKHIGWVPIDKWIAGVTAATVTTGISSNKGVYSKDDYLISKAKQEETAKKIGFLTASGSVADGAISYTLGKDANGKETGDYEIKYDSDKNPYGKTKQTGNVIDGSCIIEYDSDKSFEGKTKYTINADGTYTTEYDSDKDPYGKTKQTGNVIDGSSTTEYDSDKSIDGWTKYTVNADRSAVIEFDSDKSPVGETRQTFNADGSYTIEYNSDKNADGRTKGTVNVDGSYTIEYSNGTIENYDKDGNLIPSSSHDNTGTVTNDGTVMSSGDNYVNFEDLDKETQKEYIDYLVTTKSPTSSSLDKSVAYSNLPENVKRIVDGEVTVLTPSENINSFVSQRQDIVVPKGKSIYINGEKLIGSGMTFQYDSETGKYRMLTSNGDYAYGGYDLIDMTNSEIK